MRNTLIINKLQIIANLTNFGREQSYFEISEFYRGVCQDK
ncbi:hypothetical protein HMPREF1870_01117 [Bacteroidales bacterium KA00344]|nr:hypothetical protein HMPREF1870_01117 [Bacteroidales bacterium KA00344]